MVAYPSGGEVGEGVVVLLLLRGGPHDDGGGIIGLRVRLLFLSHRVANSVGAAVGLSRVVGGYLRSSLVIGK